jgi:hypothetical protein
LEKEKLKNTGNNWKVGLSVLPRFLALVKITRSFHGLVVWKSAEFLDERLASCAMNYNQLLLLISTFSAW